MNILLNVKFEYNIAYRVMTEPDANGTIDKAINFSARSVPMARTN